MSEFMGYTASLDCHIGRMIRAVRIEVSRGPDGWISLQPVGGASRVPVPGGRTRISAGEYEARPRTDDTKKEARWALERAGYEVVQPDHA